MVNTSAFDETAFSALKEILEEELDELLQAFIDTTPSLLENLSKAAEIHDHEQVLSLSHTLKGSSGNLAILGFSQLCGNIEAKAKNREIDQIIPNIGVLKTEFAKISEEIESILGK